jgi:hypothetical protein
MYMGGRRHSSKIESYKRIFLLEKQQQEQPPFICQHQIQ